MAAQAAYSSVPSADSPHDDAKDISSQGSTDNSTSTSPAPYLSLPGTSFTPLSLPFDSSEFFSELDEHHDGDHGGAKALGVCTGCQTMPTAKPDTVQMADAKTDPKFAMAQGNVAATRHSVQDEQDQNKQLQHKQQQQKQKEEIFGDKHAKELGRPRNGEELLGAPACHDHSEATQTDQAQTLSHEKHRLEGEGQRRHPPSIGHDPDIQQSREDDSAEITGLISRATGQAGSTPLSIPALLTFSSSRGQHHGKDPDQIAINNKQSSKPANNNTGVRHATNERTIAAIEQNGATKSQHQHQDAARKRTSRRLTTKLDHPAPTREHTTHPEDNNPPPTASTSSPTSLIEQVQETLLRASSSASSTLPHDITRPEPQPLVRTTSDSAKLAVRHPVPDLNTRSGAYIGNIAALEKTAERLSMTSSIDDAIRDLHGELKRSDSRRSSILAAAAAAASASASNTNTSSNDATPLSPEDNPHFVNTIRAQPAPPPSLGRHLSAASNIVEVNNAARYGGYSPAGYVMSPNHSLTGRMRSGSRNSAGRPDFDVDTVMAAVMSRHGPGKGSTRSVKSAKLSLAEIAETEPIALTQEALDKAEHLPLHEKTHPGEPGNKDAAEGPVPSTDAFHQMLDEGSLYRPSVELRHDADAATACPAPAPPADNEQAHPDDRPPTPRSTSTFEAGNAFGDFDGVHCDPDIDLLAMAEPEMPRLRNERPRSEMPRAELPHPPAALGKPEPYYDEQTGQQMLFYPARVPAMLNLPPKLSKKPKTAARNARQSKVLQAMGQPPIGDQGNRASQLPSQPAGRRSTWLPEPVESDAFAPFSLDLPADSTATGAADEPSAHERSSLLQDGDPDAQHIGPQSKGGPAQQMPLPTTQNDRQSTLPDDLPPQLRASAFFDLPSQSPYVEVKGGSAMDTLDSILDASANAPVDAFTDHVFAGKLGNEVYGREKKGKNRKSAANMLQATDPAASSAPKKRGSLMPFGKADTKETMSGSNSVRSSKIGERGNDEERRSLSSAVDGGPRQKREGEEGERDDANSEEDGENSDEEEDDLYQGPPTTLLAELQLRKQQQKMRTRNLHQASAGGMHSTLLELDAVAEAQRKNRKTRRVNLAWEDPDANMDGEQSDDEDVPLGLLYAAKAAGHNDISAVVAELNRPIGLMERRELEENEPLSSRRARLQGHEPALIAQRKSMMTLNPAAMSTHRLSRMPSPQRSPNAIDTDTAAVETEQDPTPPEPEPEPEVDGETLGERMRRLRAKEEADHNNLPRTRPVSMTFSAELLSQFGDLDDEKPKGAEESTADPPPGAPDNGEEETLGQRRKRLQAERLAREREISMNALNANAGRHSRKLSLADVLGAHPRREAGVGAMEEQRRMEAHRRAAQDQEEKLAAMRAQMPQTLQAPSVGTRTGGFLGGAYNDGTGGMGPTMGGLGFGAAGWGSGRPGLAPQGYQPQMQGYQGAYNGVNAAAQSRMGGGGAYGGQVYGATPGLNVGMGLPAHMGASQTSIASHPSAIGIRGPVGMNMGMNLPTQAPMQMPMQMPMAGQTGQIDSIERWRQGVMP